jgi:hypothetical protein
MNEERRDIDFSRLNLLGKIVYVGGAAARAVGDGVDRVLNHVADVVAHSEKAFREGLDENIEDARILEERKAMDKRQSSPTSTKD